MQQILTLNAGSSSIKFALFENDGGLARIAAGEIEKIGTLANPVISWQEAHGVPAPPRQRW